MEQTKNNTQQCHHVINTTIKIKSPSLCTHATRSGLGISASVHSLFSSRMHSMVGSRTGYNRYTIRLTIIDRCVCVCVCVCGGLIIMMLQLDTLRHYLALVLRGSRLVDNFIKAFSAIGRGDAIYAWWCVQASISIVCVVLCCATIATPWTHLDFR
jgi:hypothetical protein